ncbi:AAA family ATPase [Paenibacillus sacheonensis]|uniref:AAA family ATPase n=1 Tax=Paenibacillus sacheonensis TaxID=742054 RepID=A0A7X4YSI6_9BACL|nr:AAA family ATPase [Paenibacillus sacheonensis]MBM7569248.1 adenylate kinase family enzyme [Paenibacillus sacheonensis]NBC71741.1 AAA family ATPase [Paenibacillus sacheonensis]
MRKLIFFIGPAGAGKTTLAEAWIRRHGGAYLDMDTLLRPAAQALMTLAGRDPEDRDSPFYKQHCRDLGYRITMDAALQQLALDRDAVAVGPFTRETETADWLETELARIGASTADVLVKAVYVYLPDEDDYLARIHGRASSLDAWKLQNWPQFRHSLRHRNIAWPLPPESVLRFDNSGPYTDGKLAELERFILRS